MERAPESGEQPGEPTETAVRLTSGQRRALAALLQQVAQAVEHFEAWTGETLPDHPTYVERVDGFTDGERRALVETATALVREANSLAAACRIETRETSIRTALAGTFNILWSDVEDFAGERLEGYGPVGPGVRSLVGPHIAGLARLSLRLADLAANQRGQP